MTFPDFPYDLRRLPAKLRRGRAFAGIADPPPRSPTGTGQAGRQIDRPGDPRHDGRGRSLRPARPRDTVGPPTDDPEPPAIQDVRGNPTCTPSVSKPKAAQVCITRAVEAIMRDPWCIERRYRRDCHRQPDRNVFQPRRRNRRTGTERSRCLAIDSTNASTRLMLRGFI